MSQQKEPRLRARRVRAPEPVTVRVPAKVNLHLSVGDLREDGYHDVVTVLQAVALFDEVTATPAGDLTVTVRGEGAGELPTGEGNLAYRAAALLADRIGVPPAVHLDVVKAIPVAGGLAGGSADAAAALVACDALWDACLPREELAGLAARLGSDVAFALVGGTALGTGRGERLTPVLAGGRWDWVLAIFDGGLSTPEVYGELDRLRGLRGDRDVPAAGSPHALIEALRARDPRQLGELLANDLQAAAVGMRPQLRRTLRAGRELGALGALVSGSGPTCAFLAGSAEEAGRLAAALAGTGVARAVRVAHGPVGGARVTPAGVGGLAGR